MVIRKGQQRQALIQRPRLGAELPRQAVADLKQVHGIEAGIQPLVALIIGGAVQHGAVHHALVIAVQHFADEHEFRLQAAGKGAQTAHEILVQTIGHIQPQAVDAKFLHPAANTAEQVFRHSRIAQVQLYKLVMALPVLVPQAVVVTRIAAEVNVEPIPVRAGLPLLQYVPEGPKAAPHMVEHTVQHHPDARRVQRRAHARKIRVRTKAAVQLRIVPGIVAVSVGFKHRAEIHRVRPQLFDMGHPVQQLQNTRLRSAIVFPRRAAQAQRIDLVKHAFFKPHHGVTPFLRAARSAWGALCRSGSRDSLFFSIPYF